MAIESPVGQGGWVGLAVSPSGEMGGTPDGSDFMVGYIASNGQAAVVDQYRAQGTGTGMPLDDATDNISNELVQQLSGYLVAEFQRPLAGTGQDLPISLAAPTVMLWAVNTQNGAPETATDDYSQHTNKGTAEINFGAGPSTCTYTPLAPPPPPAPNANAPTSPASTVAPTLLALALVLVLAVALVMA